MSNNQGGNGHGVVPGNVGDGFMVVGLGASAGGIRALGVFFENVPEGSGMAYVVILHLSPEHDSRLAEVLQKSTRMPVTQVNESVRIEPDHVYVIPPNRSLSMQDGTLVLSDVTGIEERRAPVDIFFRTLAESHGARAACVVLSGTGANGSMGLKRVKEHGGVAVVQDPREAEYEDMPRNSIATGLVDYVLPVAEIPERLAAYRATLSLFELKEDREGPRAEPDIHEEQALAAILTQLRMRTGQDFNNYKRPTVRRRIDRRISVAQVADVVEYAHYIREHPEEARALLKDMLISVTNFFRDRTAFAALERQFIPRLFEEKGPGGHVRVWSAGCATGEEAYSLAMLLTEYAETLAGPPSIQVFASDIDEEAIQAARAGYYTLNDAADVSPERLRRFFTKTPDGYSVRRELREMVLFANHNLLKDPPFSHLDLISCRNLLIYLNRAGQEKAMNIFHFALNPGGYLFLGGAESAADYADLFVTADKGGHIFQARSVGRRLAPQMLTGAPPRPDAEAVLPGRDANRPALDVRGRLSYLDLHQRLLEMYAPPSALVNADYEIVHLSESAGRYMTLPGGEPTSNLLAVVLPDLRLELRSALLHAAQHRTNVETKAASVLVGARHESVRLHVRPVTAADDTARGFFLVLFEQAAEAVPASADAEPVRAVEPSSRQFEEELTQAKAQLRSTVEQYEVQHEELRASNEELQAMNEELRSSAEELETSKEELQSLNEELSTVNQEYRNKIEEQRQTNSDLQNLIDSTDIATVFLDRDLRVRLFTPRARDIFNLIPTDVGRPLSDITGQFADGELTDEVTRVLDTLVPTQREVPTRDGRWRLMRVSPYRSADDRIIGVVITFVDITERKQTEEALHKTESEFRAIFELAVVGIAQADLETKRFLNANGRLAELLGYRQKELLGRTLDELMHPEDHAASLKLFDALLGGDVPEYTTEIRLARKDGATLWALVTASLIRDRRGRPTHAILIVQDIDERRRVEGALRRSEEHMRTLVDSVEDFAIFSLDARGHVETWNPGAERIFGFTAEEIIGRHTAILFTPEDRARGVHEEEMRVARAEGRAADERWHVRKDGSRFYASGVLSPLEDSDDSGFVKVARDLTERERADQELRRAHEELEQRVAERTDELRRAVETMLSEVKERRAAEEQARTLVGQLVTAQEDERRRISRDLHDQLGQQLTALRLKLAAMREECDQDEVARARIQEVQALAERLDSEVDFLAWELRPTALDDLGLTAALANFVKEWSGHYGISAEAHVTGFGSGELRLPPETETCLYRITQEALNNVYKHAQAARVSVILERREGDAVIVIEDDGVGFDADEAARWEGDRGLGLVGMRERAALLGGSVEIESEPGKGTTVFARVPAARKPGGGGGE
ncbi:MAG TPA: PAS domain S-box protein [Pyrinomonadaceae bacterium]|nr:PAS domain S-box protein [Pyrinomonadaceae bacterium]